MNQILVIAEIFAGQIRPVTWELVAAARTLATSPSLKRFSPTIRVIVPAQEPEPLAETIAQESGIDVIGLQIPELVTYTSEIYIYCLEQLIQQINPSHILIAHTSQGQDFAPGLALGLNAAAISGVNGIRSNKDGLSYTRPVFDNSRVQVVRPHANLPVVLTVIPGSFKAAVRKKKNPGQVDLRIIPFVPSNYSKNRIQHKQTVKRACENQALKAARVIIAAGRGIKEKKDLKTLLKLVEYFPGSALGASRPLVDMGWLGYQHQVGITGATVKPELYIACGISGSSQHLAGIKDAGFVIAINKNRQAPIFSHADLCITADAIEFIEAFLKTQGDQDGFCNFR